MRIFIKYANETGQNQFEFDIPKSARIKELKKQIKKELNINEDCQRLFYGGKHLEDVNTLMDYKLDTDKIILLIVRKPSHEILASPKVSLPSKKVNKKFNKEQDKLEEVDNEFYKKNDLVDCLHIDSNAWFEAFFLRTVKNANQILYEVQFCCDNEICLVSRDCIRPRSKKVLNVKDLKAGTTVLLKYKTGLWHDFKVSEVTFLRKTTILKGDLIFYKGIHVPEKITVASKIYAIETEKKLKERSDKDYEDDEERRDIDEPCMKCLGNEKKNCKECGCHNCAKKCDEDKMLICDECQMYYHLWCITPKLNEIPDDDWYCSKCAINRDEIVQVGDVSKKRKKKNPSDLTTKKWGLGYACTGRRVEASVSKDHIGPIPGVEVGTSWEYRFQVSEAGVHRPCVSGIHGRENSCAFSVVLSGGYEDDMDHGDWFEYTGAGGRDLSGNKRVAPQSFDQTLTKSNKALAHSCNAPINEQGATARNWKKGKDVRVVRKADKRKKGDKNPYAPEKGFRYDGIYKVVSYKPVKGKSGFIVWRYLFRRDDPIPAPWTDEGKKRIQELGLTMIEAKKDKFSAKRPSDNDLNETDVKKRKIFEIDQKLIKLIKTDVQNKNMWNKALSAIYSSKEDFVHYINNQLTCLYCMDVMQKPTTTPCGHNFCVKCTKTAWINNFVTCIICKAALPKEYEHPSENKALTNILSHVRMTYGI